MRTTSGLLADTLHRDPARPLLTHYDDATGERVELSVATTANWVAKTANLLADELDVGPGAVVALALPRHWLVPVVALATWAAGATLAPGGDPAEADLVVCGPDGLAAASAAAQVLAAALAPLGAPFPPGTLPLGVRDLGREVPPQADRFTGPPPALTDPALRLPTAASAAGVHGALDHAALVTAAEDLADGLGVTEGGRLLLAGALDPVAEVLASAVLPLVRGASVVLVAHPDPARQPDRMRAERVSVAYGLT
jgi:uncharacterized protein (TIGR03089 family)